MHRLVRLLPPLALLGTLVLLPALALTNSSGAQFGRSGDPLFNNTCYGSDCHASFAPDSGPGTFTVEAPDTYTPGEPLTLHIRMVQEDMQKAGFQATMMDADAAFAGAFTPTDVAASKNADALGRYITHTADGTALTGEHERVWTMQWSIPEDTGPVTLYAAGVAANGDTKNSGDHVYTATKTLLPSTGTATEPNVVSSSFTLHEAYPNPFTTHTRISFELPHAAPVTLRLIDVQGRIVRTQDLGTRPSGPQEVTLQAGDLPAGLYFYEVRTPYGRHVRPILHVK